MKKNLPALILAIIIPVTTGLHAQQRISLYEGFTYPSCVPCVKHDQDVWHLADSNKTKFEFLMYHTSGPMHLENPTSSISRIAYYGLLSSPNGGRNGDLDPNPVAWKTWVTQAQVDSDAAQGSPFQMNVTHTWNTTGDSVTATVNITALSAYAPPSANMKLRIAVVQRRTYLAPLGNGENDFHNVVRQMMPDAAGTQLSNAWAANQMQTYTIKTSLNPYIDKSSETYLVAWIQNDADKHIPQAARSSFVPLSTDAGCYFLYQPITPLMCVAGNLATASPVFILKNTGLTTLTSARIAYQGNGAVPKAVYNWSGALASGDTLSVRLPALSFPSVYPYSNQIAATIELVNGAADINPGNNSATMPLVRFDTAAPASLPIVEGFEGGIPAGWVIVDSTGPMSPTGWESAQNAIKNVGRNGSKRAIQYDNGFNGGYGDKTDQADYLIVRAANLTPGKKALDFYLACSPLPASALKDKLEIVYSTDCGISWTPVWSVEGTNMGTTSPNKAWWGGSVPDDSDYAFRSIDVSNVPQRAMLAFRALRRYNNYFFIDDVTLRMGATAAVAHMDRGTGLRLYPNPATESVTLEFIAAQAGPAIIRVYDALGRLATAPLEKYLHGGEEQLLLSTSGLQAGIYQVTIHAASGFSTQRLTVIR